MPLYLSKGRQLCKGIKENGLKRIIHNYIIRFIYEILRFIQLLRKKTRALCYFSFIIASLTYLKNKPLEASNYASWSFFAVPTAISMDS